MTNQNEMNQKKAAGGNRRSGNHGQDRRRSKRLSLALRHQPKSLQLTLDENGWANVDAVLDGFGKSGLSTSLEDLQRVVQNCDKQRFVLEGGRIRASQGHSLEIDLQLNPKSPPARLFHGTVPAALESIFREGLTKQKRHHVHLSPNLETATRVGARRGKPVILVVAADRMHADGHAFYESENGVWLTDHCPAAFLEEREAPSGSSA